MRSPLAALALLLLGAGPAAAQTPAPVPAPPAYPNPPAAYPYQPGSPQPPYPYPYGYPWYPPPPPVPEFVHDGFYLRMGLGPGFGRVGLSSGGEELTMSGAMFSSSIGIGGAIAPNLILYGGLVDTSIVSPDYKVDGTTVTENGSSILITGLGPGVAYYIMPSNVYVAGTLMLTRVSQASPNGRVALSDWGPGLEGLVGKEWWVSDNWGLGVAAQIILARVGSKVDDGAFGVVAGGLLFSATYN